jgi:hypothetical protein
MVVDERIVTRASPAKAWAYLSDLANVPAWDPTVLSVEQKIPGPVGLGTQFSVAVRQFGAESSLDYHVEVFEPARRVVFIGRGPLVTVTDTIVVLPYHQGSRVRMSAELHFAGPLMLLDPLFSWMLGQGLRDAVATLRRNLDAMAG